MSKTRHATGESLWPDEERAIGQYESGMDKPKSLKAPEDRIKDPHKSEWPGGKWRGQTFCEQLQETVAAATRSGRRCNHVPCKTRLLVVAGDHKSAHGKDRARAMISSPTTAFPNTHHGRTGGDGSDIILQRPQSICFGSEMSFF